MVVDDRSGDAGRPRDRLDRDARVALLENHLQGRVEQLLASLRRRHPRRIALARRARRRLTRWTCHGRGAYPRSGPRLRTRSCGRALRSRPMRPVFDGHNDALTADDHAQLAGGKRGRPPRSPADAGRRRARRASSRSSPTGPDGDLPGDEPELAPTGCGASRCPIRLTTPGPPASRHVPRAAWPRSSSPARSRSPASIGGPGRRPRRSGAAARGRPARRGGGGDRPELEALPFWYAAGLRSLGPVWSRPNWFGEGVPFRAPSSPDTGAGLTDAGRRLVARCGELGILVDLSHLNEQGFWDVAQIDAGPLVASHSGAHALSQNSRNLTDSQLDAIGSSGGLIGIVYAPAFLREDFADDHRHADRADRRGTPRTSPSGSASSTSASARTSTAPRCPPSSATSPASRNSSTRSATSGSPTPRSTRSPGATGAACSAPGGASKPPSFGAAR